MPKISFIVTSIDRYAEVRRFFDSLVLCLKLLHLYKFELIFVNQSGTDLFDSLIASVSRHGNLELKVIISNRVPLSVARNKGLQFALGEFLAFPDDDCVYPSDLISNVIEAFQRHRDIDCFACPYSHVKSDFYSYDFLSRGMLLGRTISFSIFVRNKSILFNEVLGVGAKFGAGEESEFLLRVINPGGSAAVVRSSEIYHPDATGTSLARTINYGRGFGALSLIMIRDPELWVRFSGVKLLLAPWVKSIVHVFRFEVRPALVECASGLSRIYGALLWLLDRWKVV